MSSEVTEGMTNPEILESLKEDFETKVKTILEGMLDTCCDNIQVDATGYHEYETYIDPKISEATINEASDAIMSMVAEKDELPNPEAVSKFEITDQTGRTVKKWDYGKERDMISAMDGD